MPNEKKSRAAQVHELPRALPDSQFLICGQSATRKSTLAATFPGPVLVQHWDSTGQAAPYLRRGKVSELKQDRHGTSYREIRGRKSDQLLIRIEYYNDPDPENPVALGRWLNRLKTLPAEMSTWRTLVIDSVTGLSHNAYGYMLRTVNQHSAIAIPTREHWAALNGVAALLKEQLYSRIIAFPLNVVIIAHVKEVTVSRRGQVMSDIRTLRISAPGELQWEIASQYPEVWYTSSDTDSATKETVFTVRTAGEIDDGLYAKSQLQIHNVDGSGVIEVGRGGEHWGYKAMAAAPNGVGEDWT